jgi:ABC-type antimicrobial peptide transport system permease subunit
MNDLLLLVKSITLMYRESLLNMEEDSTKDLVRKVIEAIKTPEVSIGITKDLEIINALKATATEMVNHDKTLYLPNY